MQVDITTDCEIILNEIDAEGGVRKSLLLALLKTLYDLQEAPTEDSSSIKRVRQARRHQLWRVGHPFVSDVALRLIVWFPPGDPRAVISLMVFDKAALGDIWYTTAAVRAQATVDQLLRQNPHWGSSDQIE